MSSQALFETSTLLGSIRNEDSLEEKIHRPYIHDAYHHIIAKNEVKDLVKHVESLDAELVDYHLRAYSEEKIGFLGSHLCLVLLAKKFGSKECRKHSFFVKTVPYDDPSQMAYIEQKGCVKKETNFLKHMVPLLTKDYRGDTWAPKCYLVKENTVVFEDLKIKGFSNRSRLFDEKTARSAAACVARFHASSLLAEERLNGKSLNQIYPDLFKESEFTRTGRNYLWYETARNLAISVAEDLGLSTSFLREASERVFDMCEPSRNKRNVISHGDLWSNNILFDVADNCNLVDFQLLRYAPLAHDLMHLMYLTMTREMREKHERQLVEHYYAALTEALSVNDFKGVVPSFDELTRGVEEQRLPALVSTVINYPTIMMDGKIAATVMNDPNAYEAYFYTDRKPFVDRITRMDPEYGERIRAIVTEFVEMSLILDSLPRPT